VCTSNVQQVLGCDLQAGLHCRLRQLLQLLLVKLVGGCQGCDEALLGCQLSLEPPDLHSTDKHG
jgi:hypothetical protein